MKGSKFVFDYVHLLYYKCHKMNLNRGESYIDSPDWTKNKRTTINPINKKYSKCFQYAVTVALNHVKDDWKKFGKNNITIALNVLYAKKEKYILLMFQNITEIVKNKFFF